MGIDPTKFVREWALQLYSHPGLFVWWQGHKKKIAYVDPLLPGENSPWFDAVDEETKRLEANPPQIN